MVLFDRLSNSYIKVKDDPIRIYVCGLTVYDSPHIGHARMLITFDILNRTLRKENKVIFTQNITDIADQILEKAEKLNKTPQEIVDQFTEEYLIVRKKLNLLDCDHNPKASDYIEQMIQYIKVLIEKEAAYITNEGIYLNISKVPYGYFGSHKPVKDFALWIFTHKKYEYNYNSPWGKGKPGWHIECTVMSEEILERDFTIHGGGIDLVFPHHENEIAQSNAMGHGIPAKIWMHNELMHYKGQKMSKSIGNTINLSEFTKSEFDSDLLRFLFCSFHYRSVVDLNENLINQTRETLLNIRKKLFMNLYKKNSFEMIEKNDNTKDDFDFSALNYLYDDLNLPEFLKYIFLLLNNEKYQTAYDLLRFIGFYLKPNTTLTSKIINEKIQERTLAKINKNYLLADSIRKYLKDHWIDLIDNSNETIWFFE
jgi:cysteinyl-tRNA synthetase